MKNKTLYYDGFISGLHAVRVIREVAHGRYDVRVTARQTRCGYRCGDIIHDVPQRCLVEKTFVSNGKQHVKSPSIVELDRRIRAI